MKPVALVGALLGGAVGALIWAGISWAFSLEVGYVAWAIGGLVGGGSLVFGGRGHSAAIMCCLVTIGAILVGKVVALNITIDLQLKQQLYEQLQPLARDFVELDTETERLEFMIENGFTDAATTWDIPFDDREFFEVTVWPMLTNLGENRPRFIRWQNQPEVDEYVDRLKENVEISLVGIVFDNLDGFDLLWAFLGICTAYRVGLAEGMPEHVFSSPMPQRRREEETEEALR